MNLDNFNFSNVGPDEIAEIIRQLKPDEIDYVYSEWYKLARKDFNVFAQLVAVDDETGEPLRQAPVHRRWAELCDKYDRLLIWSSINSGKTTQLSILRTVWELGNDPTLRFAILSNTSSIAQKIVKAIAGYIINNDTVKMIFPDLRPDSDGPWTNTELKVVRKGNAKDPSVRAVGVHGALTSARVDRLIVDDILDPENTNTDANRKDLKAWYKAVATGRMSRRGKILVVGTAYHPKDLLHDLAKQGRWKYFRFPVYDVAGNIAWPEFWTQDRIDFMREELGPAEFARQMLCRARDDGEARFKQEWIDAAMQAGEGLELIFELEEIPPDCYTFTGVDLAVKKKKRADETVFFTFMEDARGRRRLLYIEAGKFTGPEIVQRIVDHHHRYGSTIVVEDNAAQDFILQFAKEENTIPAGVVVPHTTTKAKRDPIFGVEGLAVELSQNKWIIPSKSNKVAPQVDRWIEEMLFYSPKGHTGDRLMACYFARDKARGILGNRGAAKVGMRVIGGDGDESTSSTAAGDEPQRGLLAQIFDVKEPIVAAGAAAGEAAPAAWKRKNGRAPRPSVNLAAERVRVAAIHEGLKAAAAEGRDLDVYEQALMGDGAQPKPGAA